MKYIQNKHKNPGENLDLPMNLKNPHEKPSLRLLSIVCDCQKEIQDFGKKTIGVRNL
jgi:hypothetical protein